MLPGTSAVEPCGTTTRIGSDVYLDRKHISRDFAPLFCYVVDNPLIFILRCFLSDKYPFAPFIYKPLKVELKILRRQVLPGQRELNMVTYIIGKKIEKTFFDFLSPGLGINVSFFRLRAFEKVRVRLGLPGAGVEISTG